MERLKAENEELRPNLGSRVRWRQILAMLLVILTSVTLVAAAVAVWARQVALDTDRFMVAVGPALDDPAFYDLIGDKVAGPVSDALAIENRLAQRLGDLDSYFSSALVDALELGERARDILDRFDRPELQGLAPPIAAAINDRIETGILAFFNSEAFTSRFPGLVRRAHETVVAIARDSAVDHPNVYVESGEVRVNLIPFIGEALRRLGDEIRGALPDFDLPDAISDTTDEGKQQLESAIQASLPDDFGQVTVMSETRLSQLRDTVRQIDRYVWAALILTIVLLVLALVVSPSRRRTALHLGIGVFVAVVVTAVAIRRLQSEIVEELVDPRGSDFAGRVFNDMLSGLRTTQLLLAVGAILVAIVAYVSGRPDWVASLRTSTRQMLDRDVGGGRLDVWIADHSGALRALGVLVAAVALFFVGLDLLSLIVIGVLLVVYMWVTYTATSRVAEIEHVEQEETAGP